MPAFLLFSWFPMYINSFKHCIYLLAHYTYRTYCYICLHQTLITCRPRPRWSRVTSVCGWREAWRYYIKRSRCMWGRRSSLNLRHGQISCKNDSKVTKSGWRQCRFQFVVFTSNSERFVPANITFWGPRRY